VAPPVSPSVCLFLLCRAFSRISCPRLRNIQFLEEEVYARRQARAWENCPLYIKDVPGMLNRATSCGWDGGWGELEE